MVLIRSYQPKDRKSVINVCWLTGYNGESAVGRFNDSYLFGLLFCLYYTDYEPENCFVAEDEKTGQVIGYILSSLDSNQQEKQFRKHMIRKIASRAFLFTLWRHPKTFKVFWHFKTIFKKEPQIPNYRILLAPYPAHLHIDILPEYHRQGIGTELMYTLENHLKSHEVNGVHLGTSEGNTKAVQFYQKLNFLMIYEGPSGYGMWPDTPELKSLIFAKEIK